MHTITLEDSGATSRLDVHTFGTGSPKVCFTAGVHGNEYGGIHVALRLMAFLAENPPPRGTVTIMPWCNPTASRCKQRRSPFDSEDMNRIFPGNAEGSLSHKIAAALWQQTVQADYLVDLHCCGQHSAPYLLATFDEHPKARALAERIPVPVLIRSEGTGGQMFTEACRQRDQAALIIEIPSGPGSGAIHKAATELVYAGLLSLLRTLGVIPGEPSGDAPLKCGPLRDADAPAPGFWEPLPALQNGQPLEAGQLIGHVDGKAVHMPESGVIMAIRPSALIFRDDLWAVTYAQPVAQ